MVRSISIGKRRKRGFTLVEVLVSLVIFAFGLLGVAMQMTKTLSNTISNEVHSSVMQIAMQSIEPLNNAVLISRQTFSDALTDLVNNGNTPAFSTNNSQLSTNRDRLSDFDIEVSNALDSENNGLLSSDINRWKPPYTITLKINYTGKKNTLLSFYTTHVFVPAENPT